MEMHAYFCMPGFSTCVSVENYYSYYLHAGGVAYATALPILVKEQFFLIPCQQWQQTNIWFKQLIMVVIFAFLHGDPWERVDPNPLKHQVVNGQ